MKELRGKLAYLKGFAEGVKLDQESNEGKLLVAIIDTLEEMTVVIEDVIETQIEMDDYLEVLDEDLGDLEADIYGDEEEYFEDEDEDEEDEEYEEDEEEDEDEYEEEDEEDDLKENVDGLDISCPHCFGVINLEPNVLENQDKLEITCPNCNKAIYLESENEE